MNNEKHETLGEIDYGQALQRGLERIARDDLDGGSTERLRRPGEHPAPTRTTPVKEVSLSLTEFVGRSEATGSPL
ncbi:hypothetical protein [Roseateles sp.]|uniref:hypothetical protein n=1 Tax=Roseateles sp. TaxID=1971397 RepID=UPI003D09FEBB